MPPMSCGATPSAAFTVAPGSSMFAGVWLDDKDEWGPNIADQLRDRVSWANPQGVIAIEVVESQSAPFRGQRVTGYSDGQLTHSAMFYAPTPPQGEVWEFLDTYRGVDHNTNLLHKDSNVSFSQLFVVPNNAA